MRALSRFLTGRCLSRRFLTRSVTALAGCYAVALLLLLALEDRLLFHPYPPSRQWVEPPQGIPVKNVFLSTPDGTKIHARWYPRTAARLVVLVCHDRAGNLSLTVLPDAVRHWHADVGASVLVFDYPGYGHSEGSPSEQGCYAAADAAYDWLTQVVKVPAEEILILGRSLGTGVAVELASRRPHRALVLISPFTSLPDVGDSLCPLLPTRLLMRNRFDSLARIGRCSQPLLVVHGTRDRLVPFALGKRLFAAAPGPKRFVAVEGASHGDTVNADFFPTLLRFLAEVVDTAGGEKLPAALASGPAGAYHFSRGG